MNIDTYSAILSALKKEKEILRTYIGSLDERFKAKDSHQEYWKSQIDLYKKVIQEIEDFSYTIPAPVREKK